MKESAPHTEEIRRQFPQLRNSPLIYFDNAATSLKPETVVRTMTEHLSRHVCNVHRGSYALSEEVTAGFENARHRIAASLGARGSDIVFTQNTTMAMNLLADMFIPIKKRVLISEYDHHSHLAPWSSRFTFETIPCDADGVIDLNSLKGFRLNSDDIVCLTQVSNVTGIVQPIREASLLCAEQGAITIVDGAQGYPHIPVDVRELGCDFYVYSAHKALGPAGVGIIFGRAELWREMTPRWMGGGTFQKFSLTEGFVLNSPPYRFEAGTPNVEGVLASAAAADFLTALDKKRIAGESEKMYQYLCDGILRTGNSLRILGFPSKRPKVSILTLTAKKFDADQTALLLSDRYGIYARSGLHCAHSLYRKFGVEGGLRLSPYLYNTYSECDRVIEVIRTLFP